ncbi:hypothetical protein GYMLUDRAFT_414442 [Collybiopsis luxurians FD-317 M1]|nr:hypothetical protein GYMLUDRAFT_414442 [Collybiopsis luxurians FD-317 M1]
MVYGRALFKVYDSVRWRWDPAGEEEETKILERYHRLDDVYLLQIYPFHLCTNFLSPRSAGSAPPPPSLSLPPIFKHPSHLHPNPSACSSLPPSAQSSSLTTLSSP